MARVLITGASGFIGSVLARRMLQDGHEVHVLLRDLTKTWRIKDIIKDLRLWSTDLRDQSRLNVDINAISPELIYHFAAYGCYPFQSDVNNIVQTNIMGTWNLLQATSKIDYELFINAGSSSEYGFKDHPMCESDFLEPNSYYSFAKSSQTLMCQYYARAENKPIINYRLFSVYGPYEEPTRLIPTVISRCLNGQDVDLTNPSVARDFVYVDDVVDVCILKHSSICYCGEIFNIGSGKQSTILEVAKAIKKSIHATGKINCNVSSPRVWDAETWVGDCSKAEEVLGWRAKTSLGEGLVKTIEWTKNNERFRK